MDWRLPPRKEVWLPRSLKATVDRLLNGTPTLLDLFTVQPASILERPGIRLDPWQAAVLSSQANQVQLLCSRQVGKSMVAGAVALNQALTQPESLVLILSPSERQSGEIFQTKVLRLYEQLGRPVPCYRQPKALQLHLKNGSRIIALPENETTIRCYAGVSLLVVDESSKVSDALYFTVRPMLAVSRGRLIALSTPFGKRGWFYNAWDLEKEDWEQHKITAYQCPRISAEFLAKEKRALGERWFKQEYLCSFEDPVDVVFTAELVRAAIRDDIEPLVV